MKAKQSAMISVLLVTAIVMILMTLTVQEVHADEPIETVVDGVKYTLNDDGTAEVSGYTEDLPNTVVIPVRVTLNDVSYTVTSIGENAFIRSKLESITFEAGSKLEKIGIFSFGDCSNLKNITIPSSVTSIGQAAFKNLGLESVTFAPKSKLKEIGSIAFAYCTDLKSITIPAGVKVIEPDTFYKSSLESISFETGSKLEAIKEKAFYECNNLKSVMLPANLTSIGQHAFYECNNLKSITIPAGVKTIEPYTFSYSGLISIAFKTGSKLEVIEEMAFYGCRSLKSITIPASVTSIGPNAFSSCEQLESVIFKSDSKLNMIGDYAFSGCHSLTSFTIPADVMNIKKDAFVNCNELKSFTFEPGSKLEKIGDNALAGCHSLKSITIPAGVTNIGENAITYCNELKSVTFEPGSKIEKIGERAFYNDSMQYIHYFGTAENFALVEKGNNWKKASTAIHYVTGDPLMTPATLDDDGSDLYVCSEDGCDWTYTVTIYKPTIFKLSANKFTYNGKARKPSVTVGDGIKDLTAGTDYDVNYASGRKNVGSYKVTVNLKGNYSGSKSISFKIVPKKASIRSAKPGKKKIKVTMSKKVKSTGGKYYKIQYRVKGAKKWKTTKTSKQALTISKLKKGKKYQIRVCAYKDVKGTKYTGAWSKVKTTSKVK